jgi:hypothetical protein
MSEEMSLAAFWDAAPAADRKEKKWLKGPTITQENLKNGTGAIEKVTPAVWFSKTSGKPATSSKGPLKMSFGKYKGRLAIEVREDDPHYWNWALDNVDWFAKQVKDAGL